MSTHPANDSAVHATAVANGEAIAQSATPARDVILVSHGYENIYERGFCNGLSDRGFDFSLISSDRTDYAGLRPGTRTVNLRGSQEEGRPKWDKGLNLARYHLRLAWHMLRHRKAIFHTIGLIEPPLLYGVIVGAWCRLVAHRYVLTVHNLLPHDRETRRNEFYFRIAFRLAHRLVVHTPRMRDELMSRYGIAPARITIMEHGLEPLNGRVLPLRRYARPEPFKILFFGFVGRYKGLDILIDALAGFPHPFSLTVAGFCGDGALAAELRAKIDAHPHRDSIHWDNKYVVERDIEPLFTGSHVLAMPYRNIDQSGVLFQALRFGLPVVATRVGQLARYIDNAVGEVCEPMDGAAFCDALVRLADRYDAVDRQAIVEIGRRYEWQNTVEPLRSVYR